MRKCFDTVHPDQAISLWESWGAPPGLVRTLREFYERHERWVEYRGAVAQVPLRPKRSLLQGCPASPLLLAGIMTVWVLRVRQVLPDVSMGVYLDDRTIWALGEEGPRLIAKALGWVRRWIGISA